EDIPEPFINKYLKVYPLRDLLLKSPEEVKEELKNDYQLIAGQSDRITPAFAIKLGRSPLETQVRIFSLLLMKENINPAVVLYELQAKESPVYQQMLRDTLHHSLQRKLTILLGDLEVMKKDLANKTGKALPFDTQIMMS